MIKRFIWVLWVCAVIVAHYSFGLDGHKLDGALMAAPFVAFANQMVIKEG